MGKTSSATAQQVNRPLATKGMQSNVDWKIVETGYVATYTDENNSNCIKYTTTLKNVRVCVREMDVMSEYAKSNP